MQKEHQPDQLYLTVTSDLLKVIIAYCLKNKKTVCLNYCGAHVRFDGRKIHSTQNDWNLEADEAIVAGRLEILMSLVILMNK